ncbi:Oligosaccharide translocation protein rft1 [Dissophora globulifera]|uniref:Man(5)GlcNAc(2)-PP-dolichol translocation protein RFT1 n=1 Tax=Dissophora globulifera TaxID=979702 RepID=A0A9P6RKC2_9FUNG|nr:Oligosaccharide translocation protein rft1 [Dissophora globulifera]
MDAPGRALRQRTGAPTAASTLNEKHSGSAAPATASTSTSATQAASSDQASSILSSSVQGASYLVLLQFISRMLTFSLNQVLLRFTSAETLGIASVQLELLLNTILFLSREGVRCAAIRVSDDTDTDASGTESSLSRPLTDRKGKSRDQGDTNNADPRPGSEAYRLQKLVNMVYAPIPVGALMTCLAVGYYLSQVDDEHDRRFPGYRLSICLYGLAALIELLAEPMFMVAQYKLWFKTRVSVEGMAVIVRCVLTCALTLYGARAAVVASMPGHHPHEKSAGSASSSLTTNNTMGVLAFAIAQFVYGLLTLGGFLLAFYSKSAEKHQREKDRLVKAHEKYHGDRGDEIDDKDEDVISIKALLPRRLVRTTKDGRQESFYFDTELLKLSKTLTAQSLLKHILTEGDKMLMTGFTAEQDQGVYAFVVNYGSLVARIIFQPMEETSRTLFSKLLSDIAPASQKVESKDKSSSFTTASGSSAVALTETQRTNLVVSRNLLLTIMKFHVLLGLVFIAFGTHYTGALIELVVGRNWSRNTIAPAVLSLYCWYVPIMGLNGITEAVVQAVASENELTVLSYWMVGFSAVFCGSGAFLMGVLGLGAKGIVLANCLNLTMRIVWSMWFLSRYYGRYIPAHGSPANNNTHSSQSKAGMAKTFSNVPWRDILPRWPMLAAFAAAYVITASSEHWITWETPRQLLAHLLVGVATFASVAIIFWIVEAPFLREIRGIVRQRRSN